MKDNHCFSDAYEERKRAVRTALKRESAVKGKKSDFLFPRMTGKILVSALLISVLAVGTLAASRLIDFRAEQDGNKVTVHAGLNKSEESETLNHGDKPLRGWRTEEGEISIRLNIPDLPADMEEDKTANGKYHGGDQSRAMTVNGIDLRRSDLDHLIGGASETKRLTVGGREMIIVEMGEAEYYSRIAYLVIEEEELVLKAWVSWGITDEELLTLAATLSVEETADVTLALPIQNEVNGTGTASGQPDIWVVEDEPIYEADLLAIGESAREANDWFTLTVNDVSVYDNIHMLKPECILQSDKLAKFTDENGCFIPYNRTPVIADENGKRFGESEIVTKKLYVITLTTSELDFSDFEEEDRYTMLRACVNGFKLHGYTVADGEISMISRNTVIDRTIGEHAMSGEPVYREDLGGGQWMVGYLVDDDIAEGSLVLGSYTGKVYVKLR